MSAGDAAFTLLSPGPVHVSPAVREALARCPDQCHREPEYRALQQRVREKLAAAFGAARDYEAVLITGSGTAAMEAMVVSLARRGLLVLENGIYGSRLAAIADAHRIPVRKATADWLERPDPARVDALAAEGGVDALAVVHHETTTGLVNDLPALAAVARRRGLRLLVDSVSGLGGEELDLAALAPDAVCGTANKCLQGLPGASFVLVRRGLSFERRSLYLDLGGLLSRQREGETSFTPAIQVIAALDAALDELIEETVPGRIARYARAASVLRAALAEQRLPLLLAPELRSNTISTARLPEGVTYPRLHDALREEGYVVYAGLGGLSERAFRVANMGWIPEARLAGFGAALARARRRAAGGEGPCGR